MKPKTLRWIAAGAIAAMTIIFAADLTFSNLAPQDADSASVLQQKLLAAVNANTTAVNNNGGGGGGSIVDTAFGAPWNGDTTHGASLNQLFAKFNSIASGSSVFANAVSVSSPNFKDQSTLFFQVNAATNILAYPTNLTTLQLSSAAGIVLAQLASIGAGTILGNATGGATTPSALSTLPAAVQANITALGTIASGVWNGTPLATLYIANNAIDNTKLAQMANHTLKVRNTAGTGNAEDATLSTVLDWVSSAQGTVLYRGASGWVGLAPGTSGFFLKTLGAGADPVWASAAGSGDFSGPGSSTNNNLVSFNGTGGKTGKDSGLATDGAGSLSASGTITAGSFSSSGTSAGAVVLGDGGSHTYRISPQTMSGDANFQPDTSAKTGVPFHTATTTNVVETHLGVSGTGSVLLNDFGTSLGANNTFAGVVRSGLNNSGGVTQWDVVYLNSSSQWVKADADGSGTFPARGLATATVSTGGATTAITRGTVRNDAWTWTPGGTIYLSTTAGGLTQTAPSTTGNTIQVVGYALSATTIAVEISTDTGVK